MTHAPGLPHLCSQPRVPPPHTRATPLGQQRSETVPGRPGKSQDRRGPRFFSTWYEHGQNQLPTPATLNKSDCWAICLLPEFGAKTNDYYQVISPLKKIPNGNANSSLAVMRAILQDVCQQTDGNCANTALQQRGGWAARAGGTGPGFRTGGVPPGSQIGPAHPAYSYHLLVPKERATHLLGSW